MPREPNSYQNEIFFPKAVSGENPHTILCSILKLAVSDAKQKSHHKLESYETKRKQGFLEYLERFLDDTALSEWVWKEFTYETRGRYRKRLVMPYHSSAHLLTSESYDIIFESLMRAGRSDHDSDTVLKKFINYFRETARIDDIVTKLYVDLSESKFIDDEGRPRGLTRKKYSYFILCQPHARLFQNDVEVILNLQIPRRELLDMLISVISYHLCAYIIRMGLVALEHEHFIRKYSKGHRLQSLMPHKCYKCHIKYRYDSDIFSEKYLNLYLLDRNNCGFNDLFFIGNEEHVNIIKEALYHFPKRMFLFNALISIDELKVVERIDFLSKEFYRNISGKSKIISEIDRRNTATRAWKHTFEFFQSLINRFDYGMNNIRKTKRTEFQFRISDSLLKSLVAVCCFQNRSEEVFLDNFFEFMRRRGIDFVAQHKVDLIQQMEDEGLATILEDAGSAKCIKNPFQESYLDKTDGSDK